MKTYSKVVIYRCKNDKNIHKFTISCPARDVLTVYASTLKRRFIDVETMKTCPKNSDL